MIFMNSKSDLNPLRSGKKSGALFAFSMRQVVLLTFLYLQRDELLMRFKNCPTLRFTFFPQKTPLRPCLRLLFKMENHLIMEYQKKKISK